MLLQAQHVETEMKNLNIQVTLLVQNGVGTLFPPTTPLGMSLSRWITYRLSVFNSLMQGSHSVISN